MLILFLIKLPFYIGQYLFQKHTKQPLFVTSFPIYYFLNFQMCTGTIENYADVIMYFFEFADKMCEVSLSLHCLRSM